jgi:hypothetical protein
MPTSLAEIAERGEAIYKERYRQEDEAKYRGRFVAIDVITEDTHVAETPEGALEQARKENRSGLFHLIRIGSPGVYRVAYTAAQDGDWLLGR